MDVRGSRFLVVLLFFEQTTVTPQMYESRTRCPLWKINTYTLDRQWGGHYSPDD